MKLFEFNWFSGYGGLRCYTYGKTKVDAIELFNKNTVFNWAGETEYNTITEHEVDYNPNDGVPIFGQKS